MEFQYGTLFPGVPRGGVAISSLGFFFRWAGRNTEFWDEEFVKIGKKLCLAGNDPFFFLGFSSTRK